MAKVDFHKHIWEGWTVQHFIDELEPTLDHIMDGNSWKKPFTTRKEIADWCKENQPYYKKEIKDVTNYFCSRYCISN